MLVLSLHTRFQKASGSIERARNDGRGYAKRRRRGRSVV